MLFPRAPKVTHAIFRTVTLPRSHVTQRYIIARRANSVAPSRYAATLNACSKNVLVVAAVAAGESYRKVALRFDVTPPTVMRWYREAHPDDSATVAAALACLAEGWAPLDVAHAAGVNVETVRRWRRAAAPHT